MINFRGVSKGQCSNVDNILKDDDFIRSQGESIVDCISKLNESLQEDKENCDNVFGYVNISKYGIYNIIVERVDK